MKKSFQKGFSILELLLTMALLAIIGGLAIPVSLQYLRRNDIWQTSSYLANAYRRAQVLSQSIDGNETWGVKAQTSSIVVFRGSSYANRNTNFDETTIIADNISFSGMTETVFSRVYGLPSIYGTTSISNFYNQTSSIYLNAKGFVSY